MKKGTIFAGFFVLMMLAVLAMPSKTYAMEADFDDAYYAAKNPDVVAAYGTDANSLYQHYVDYGRAEGRYKNAYEENGLPYVPPAAPAASSSKSQKVPADFDASYYASKNPDVVAVYGTDPANLYKHYVDYGRAEGRFKNAAEEGGAPAAPAASATDLPYPTYVDVDIANQRVTYYENGVAVISSGCVSGNTSLGRGTPKGTWKILAHTKGKTLTGPTWRVWVDYWMQFTPSACGLHDATWRSDSEFGSGNYTSNGSHGCVNLPHAFAADLFNRVNVGTIVVVH